MNRVERYLYQLTLSADDRIEIYDNFSQYLRDGVSAQDTFKKLIANYSRRGKKPGNAIAKILQECADNLSAGYSLSESLSEWIPEQELSIIESCDEAGRLPEGFDNAMLIAGGTGRIVSAVRGAAGIIIYMSALLLGIISLFCILLVPVLKQAVPLSQWNGIQLGIYYLYLVITDYYWIILIIVAALIFMVRRSLDKWTGNLRFYADKLPPYSIYKRLHGATFILNVNAMLSVGIPMEEAIKKMTRSCRSDWLAERLEATSRSIESGEQNLGMALDVTGYEFPGEEAIIKMQSLFETNNSNGSLKRFAEKWLDKTIKGVEQTSERLRIVSILGCGVFICVLIVVMFDLIQRAFFFNS
ncbi:conjugal transfer protein [bacteria symbiont BFo1 of Frankliniella occidentalis]|uniref:type II secretion system F family protein n=1 Tax=Erwinia TaxID=551 RepID=UPI0006645367|nr:MULTISPECIES: type II secretion system F family protein [Erwinia]KMV67234.1 conjugal transfer protein [bacteria symbiont BFo1 of Frankliniella occidentalis]KYP82362.1 conjugal transfer protein [bacteria symbiont BFo1 of Frankliniella occidentalis]KYP86872.1 conjugal transfer protein [bacteria symbiont BFo1 of Frankliniella occidentalis]MDI3440249.1 type II secretion system F family protein [Erwinia sp. V90_4]CAH0297544.1 Toxin coregulated pilus biosynthesis protein E [Erwinia aphidicola]